MIDSRRLEAMSAGRLEWGVQVATFVEWYVFETAPAWRWVLEVESKKAESLPRLRRPRT
jgi:hypothetical protein